MSDAFEVQSPASVWKAALVSPINTDGSRLQRSGQKTWAREARGLIRIAHVIGAHARAVIGTAARLRG